MHIFTHKIFLYCHFELNVTISIYSTCLSMFIITQNSFNFLENLNIQTNKQIFYQISIFKSKPCIIIEPVRLKPGHPQEVLMNQVTEEPPNHLLLLSCHNYLNLSWEPPNFSRLYSNMNNIYIWYMDFIIILNIYYL